MTAAEQPVAAAAAAALREAAEAARGMHDPPMPDCAEWADWLDARADVLFPRPVQPEVRLDDVIGGDLAHHSAVHDHNIVERDGSWECEQCPPVRECGAKFGIGRNGQIDYPDDHPDPPYVCNGPVGHDGPHQNLADLSDWRRHIATPPTDPQEVQP